MTPSARQDAGEVLVASRLPGFIGAQAVGTMTRSPFSGGVYRAELGVMPLANPREYFDAHLFEKPVQAPVMICPSQRYAILAGLVVAARNHVPGLTVVCVRLCGPDFQVPLPADLLAADVLLTHAPTQIVPRLLQAGRRNVVTIHHGLRTDAIDLGRNEIEVALFKPTGEALTAFLQFVFSDRTLSSLADLSLMTLREAPIGQ